MAKQEFPLDVEIIFKKVEVSVWQKAWMFRNRISWNDKDEMIMKASMIELKEKLEIVGDSRGSSEVRDVPDALAGVLLYSNVLNAERRKVYELRMANSCYNTIIRWTEVEENLRMKLYSDVVRILKTTSYIFKNNLGKSISISMIGSNDGIIVTCRNADNAVAIRSNIEDMLNNFRAYFMANFPHFYELKKSDELMVASGPIKEIFKFTGGVLMTKTDIFDIILSLKITCLKRIGEISFDYLQNSSKVPDGKGHVVLFFKEDSTTQIKETYEAFFENKNLLRIVSASKSSIGKLTLSREKADDVESVVSNGDVVDDAESVFSNDKVVNNVASLFSNDDIALVSSSDTSTDSLAECIVSDNDFSISDPKITDSLAELIFSDNDDYIIAAVKGNDVAAVVSSEDEAIVDYDEDELNEKEIREQLPIISALVVENSIIAPVVNVRIGENEGSSTSVSARDIRGLIILFPPTGLSNPTGSNLCAVNSMLQVLRASSHIQKFLIQNLVTTGENDPDQYCRELIKLTKGGNEPFVENLSCSVLSKIIQNRNLVVDHEQSSAMIRKGNAKVFDANEQFSLALRRLISLQRKQREKLELKLEDLFNFTLKEITRCSNCNNEFFNYSERIVSEMSFKISDQGKKIDLNRIQSFLDYWSCTMPSDYKCNECKKAGCSIKVSFIAFEKPPDLVYIHLDRLSQSVTEKSVFNNIKISNYENLEMSMGLNKVANYKFIGGIEFYTGGHYAALVKINGTLYKCDDMQVVPKPSSEFNKFNPTILLFEFDKVIIDSRNKGTVSLLEEISLRDTETEESAESTPPPAKAIVTTVVSDSAVKRQSYRKSSSRSGSRKVGDGRIISNVSANKGI